VILFLRSLLFNLFAWLTILLGATVVLLTFWAPQRFHWWVCVGWCRFATWSLNFFCGIDVAVEGRENIPDEPCLIMLKHTSTFETFWHVTIFPQTAWVVKREMMWIPLIGWAIYLALDPIAINRESGRSAIKQVIEQGKEKFARGIWVSVFPEGTRMPPGKTRKYGSSGAALARDAGVKILPIAHNAGDLWRRRSFIKRPGTVRVRIGPLIDPAERPPKEVNLIAQEWIETQMHEISSAYKEKYAQPSPD
jgi:1-acyl-sn-glycerol-3-phosphate acyltransferase